MDGLPPDLGKLASPGYINADPPDQPVFALSANGTGYATSIQQAGGEVTVDNLGGIGLLASSGSQLGIDSFANIFLETVGGGTILLETAGSGDDVNIVNAGTIDFDPVGAGAITNIQTINGVVYPPPGTGSASITQSGALVACLGNGGVLISSIGAGVTADVVNAGTIGFDSAGPRAISGLSTINGVAWVNGNATVSQIEQAGAIVECDANGTVIAQSAGSAYLNIVGSGINIDAIELTSGSGRPAISMSAQNDILLDNPGATLASYISMTAGGEISVQGSATSLTAGGPSGTITLTGTDRITLTTSDELHLYAGGNLQLGDPGIASTDIYMNGPIFAPTRELQISSITGVNTIANAGATLNMNANVLQLYGATATLGDGYGAGFQFIGTQPRVIGNSGLIVDSDLSVSTITNVSSINGLAYPAPVDPNPTVSTLTAASYVSTIALNGLSTINGAAYVAPLGAFVDSFQIYVSPNGNDTTGTGSSQLPFATIGRAITKRATLSTSTECSIILSSGTYTESPTLVRNTYLVGVQTGEARQPCNVTGTITMNDTTGNIGISGLEVTGSVTTSTGGPTYTIFGCNISNTSTAINATGGTVFITECRISNTTAATIISFSTLTLRDCNISTSGTGSCLSLASITTVRQCVIISSSASTSVAPLVSFANANAAVSEIGFCRLEYTSTATDVTGNKCCVKFAGAGTATSSIHHSLLLCEGAITGSPQIQCIQDTGAGAVNLAYGSLLAGATAHHISPNVTKTAYNVVP